MSEMTLSYPTHELVISQQPTDKFTRITNYVVGDVYQRMIDSIISDGEKAFDFVRNERVLLNNFLQSLIAFHNREKTPLFPPIYAFKDDAEFVAFCIVNDITYEPQIWFKTAFVRADIYSSLSFAKEASILLLSTLYPDYYQPSESMFEKWIKQFEEKRDLYKCDPETYKSFLESNEIEAVYHFTSYKNVDSVNKYGICSILYLKELGILPDFVSTSKSQSIDKNKGLEDYIHLGFERRHPMLMMALAKGILGEYKVYDVNPSVLFLKDTKYTNMNAIKRGAQIHDSLEFLLNIPFRLFHKKDYFNLSSEAKDLFQSEILVKRNIPKSLIMN